MNMRKMFDFEGELISRHTAIEIILQTFQAAIIQNEDTALLRNLLLEGFESIDRWNTETIQSFLSEVCSSNE